jgi:hypothetical protein
MADSVMSGAVVGVEAVAVAVAVAVVSFASWKNKTGAETQPTSSTALLAWHTHSRPSEA